MKDMDQSTINDIITKLTAGAQPFVIGVTYSPSITVNGLTACECIKVAINASDLENRNKIEEILTSVCTNNKWNIHVYDDPDSDMGFMIF